MDYKKYLLNQPLIVGFPRNIVEIINEDGSSKILYVNSQLIDAIRSSMPDGPLQNAIREYLKTNPEAKYASAYLEKSADQKVSIGTINLDL